MCLGGAHCEFWARKTARVEATPTASFACRELRPRASYLPMTRSIMIAQLRYTLRDCPQVAQEPLNGLGCLCRFGYIVRGQF